MTRSLFEGILDEAINHGFSQRRPIRSVQIPTEVGKSPTDFTDIHRFFLGRFFSHADFADDADFFLIRWHGIYSEVFLMRRLHTDFRGGDLSGRCRYPLRLEKVPQRKICVYLWNLWDEIIHTKKNLRHLWNLWDKIIHTKKNLCHLWNLWDKIIHTKKNLRHLRNLRDKNNRSIYRARAIGQRPNIRENPWVIR